MEKEQISLPALERWYDYEFSRLKDQLKANAPRENLLNTVKAIEDRRARIRALEKAEAFRRTLGLWFVIIAVAFVRALAVNPNVFTKSWVISFGWYFVTTAAIVWVAYKTAHTTLDEQQFKHTLMDHLPNCGGLLLLLAVLAYFANI